MEGLRRSKNSCTTCGKTAGAFICRGCSKNFCLQHTNEHRQVLEKEMNDLMIDHDHLKQSVTNQVTEQYRQTLMKQIDRWEQQSIDKIHHTSNEIRQQLLAIDQGYSNNIKEKLSELTQQLTTAQYDGDFFENELRQWKDVLYKLQHTLIEQENIQIYQDNNSVPFISKISLTEKRNVRLIQPINQITDENNYKSSNFRTVQDEYSSGDHLLRFRIENYQPNSWVIMGIVSKNLLNSSNPFKDPTFYGWTNDNLVYRHGVSYSNYKNYKCDIENDDVFQLTVNCDRQLISLTNERTRRTHELSVDVNKCPFPWQANVRLLNNKTNKHNKNNDELLN